jgi:hypothetical protein
LHEWCFAHRIAIDGSQTTTFVRIIACEHDLLVSDDTIVFDALMLNKALRVDIRLKGADDRMAATFSNELAPPRPL